MESIVTLWLPIVLSAVAVFLVSSVLHMVFTYHNSDYKTIPNEEKIMDDLRKYNIPPGDYMIPYQSANKDRNTPEFKEKLNKGPVMVTTVFPTGQMSMGSSLALWFLYAIIVGMVCAYVVWHALIPGDHYQYVFRFVGMTAFAGYSLALMQNSIWYKKSWTATLKSMLDGVIYALLTAGIFGWLWPAAAPMQ
ncbi:MAG: hypothetical protein IPM56_17855 [Ignavibacteriales bacterium]|nr:MAG: hypothetical protein IPM56_17855 [Ignavibacteriales bacterium]